MSTFVYSTLPMMDVFRPISSPGRSVFAFISISYRSKRAGLCAGFDSARRKSRASVCPLAHCADFLGHGFCQRDNRGGRSSQIVSHNRSLLFSENRKQASGTMAAISALVKPFQAAAAESKSATPSGSRPWLRSVACSTTTRSTGLGKSTHQMSSKRLLRSSSGGSPVTSFEVATTNAEPERSCIQFKIAVDAEVAEAIAMDVARRRG
jgi:hypothetical protein